MFALVVIAFLVGIFFIHEWIWSKINVGKEFMKINGKVVWFTGLSGAGKSTIADAVAENLRARMLPVARLDGDVARRTFSKDLGFSLEDRAENCRAAAHIASYLAENHIVLASFISPTKAIRDYVRHMCPEVLVVHVKCSIDGCIRRDPKGMYGALKNGCFKGVPFIGMHDDAKYHPPLSEHVLEIDTEKCSIDEAADLVIKELGL